MLLAIETSCDETAVAVLDDDDRLVADLVSSQISLHVPYGGVVPELAAREHVKNLPLLIDELERAHPGTLTRVTAVAVTQGPGLKGCLLVGLCFAKALAFRLGVPLIPVNHLEGHLLAGDLLPPGERPAFPFLALLVSGGHTSLVLLRNFRSYELLAETLDDAVGEAFDKCATLLGLPYPGGPALSQLAERGNPASARFPLGVGEDPKSFSFSGLKTAFLREVRRRGPDPLSDDLRADLAASIEKALVDSLVPKTCAAASRAGVANVLLTGGVAANRRLREELRGGLVESGVKTIVLPPRWCGDNAAMIAVAARALMRSRDIAKIDDMWLSTDAKPRFPLEELHAAG